MQDQSKNSINEGIKHYQYEKRASTIKAIEDAIEVLNSLDKKITVAKLVEMTGMHRTTFYKPEIRKIWDTKRKVKVIELSQEELDPDLRHLLVEKEKINEKYLKSLGEREELIEKNKKLQQLLEEQKRKNEILRGQILTLQQENNILRR